MAPPWRAVPHDAPNGGAAAEASPSAHPNKPKAMPPLAGSVPLARGSNPWTRSLRSDPRLEGKSGIPATRVLLPKDSPLLVPITERSLYSAHEVGLEATHPSAAAYTFGCGKAYGAAQQPEARGARLQPPSVEALQEAFGSAAGALSIARKSARSGPSPRLFHNLHGTFGAPPPARDLVGRLSDGSYHHSVPSRHEPPLDLDVLVSSSSTAPARVSPPRGGLAAAAAGGGVVAAPHAAEGSPLRLRRVPRMVPQGELSGDPLPVAAPIKAIATHDATSGAEWGGGTRSVTPPAPSAGAMSLSLFGTDTRSLPNPYASLWKDAA